MLYRPMALLALSVYALATSLAYGEQEPGDSPLFEQHCATCHDDPRTKAPSREALQQMPAARIIKTMEFGKMAPMAKHLSMEQRLTIANQITAVSVAERDSWIDKNRCETTSVPYSSILQQANWGFGTTNQRAASHSAINKDNIQKLELAWSMGFPGVTEMRAQPASWGDTLYIGTQNGNLLALQQATGCVIWRFQAGSGIRSALSLVADTNEAGDNTATLFFADDLGSIYAVDATTGKGLWQRNVKWFPTSVISGSLSWHKNRLYVPLSSFEVTLPAMPEYPCCNSHGGVVSLDANTGETVWEYHTTEPAKKTFVNQAGTQQWGPSGASVWTTPTIDDARGVLYIGTGENLSLPATETSDAVIALDLASGKERWRFQALANDVWNSACLFNGPNCPENPGPDFDFGGAAPRPRSCIGSETVLSN